MLSHRVALPHRGPLSQHRLLPSFRHVAARLPCKLVGSVANEVASEPAAEEAPVKWWKKDCPPNMKDVNNVQELVDALADAGDNLVIVEFYAPWCNACKALFPKICRIVAEHEEVIFLKVSFEDNKDMCKNMGVKVLPFFRLFQGAKGKVAEFSCTVSKIQRFRDAIEEYNGAFCSLEEPPGIEEFPEIHVSDEHHHPLADTITKLAWN